MSTVKAYLVSYKDSGKDKHDIFRDKRKASKFRNKKGGKINLVDLHIDIMSNISKDVGYGD